MNMTKCPDCRRLSFADATSCPSYERAFRPGELRAQADAEERSLGRRVNGVFAALFLAAPAALAFVMFKGA